MIGVQSACLRVAPRSRRAGVRAARRRREFGGALGGALPADNSGVVAHDTRVGLKSEDLRI